MSLDPLAFAHGCATRGPCAQFVARWLAAQGVGGLPSRRAIFRDWRRFGVEEGVALWCKRLGLTPCAPQPLTIALAAPPEGEPLLGVLSADGLFVTRSFSRILVARDLDMRKAWRV